MERPELVFDRVLFKIRKSPDQYKNAFDTEKAISEKSEKIVCCVFFGDILEYNQKAIDQFFTRKLHLCWDE